MASEVGDLYVTIRAITEPFTRSMRMAAGEGEAATRRIEGSATRTGGAFKKLASIGMVAGGIAAGIGAISVKWAADFQSEITKLHTQAGVATSQMKTLQDGVLNLAGQVGFSPTSLAESLYHVESNFESVGISAPKALQMVKIAAEGAAVGHANLVDVTNALTAAVASGIPGVQNMSKAMGVLNATVGIGDMSMQNLAEAFGTGMLATVKGFGVNINDVSAGLALFGDNNIRGAAAGTQFRMAIQALAKPAAGGLKTIHSLGLATNELSKDMQKGGLKLAIEDLVQHMKDAGITSKQQGQIITDAFGKKAGTGLNIMVGQFQKLESKYPKAIEGATKFDGAWKTTQKNFSQQLHQTEQGLVAMGIKLGTVLMPYVQKFLGWIQKGIGWLTQHKGAVMALAGALATTLVAAIIAVGTAMYAALGPELLIATAIIGIGAAVVYAYNHFRIFRTIVNDVGRFLAGAFKLAWQAAATVVHWFAKHVLPEIQYGFKLLEVWFQNHKKQFVEIWQKLVKDVQDVVHWFQTNVLAWVKARIADLSVFWKQHGDQIMKIAKLVFDYIGLVAKIMWNDSLHPLLVILAATWHTTWVLMRDGAKVVWAVISGTVKTVMHDILNTISLVLDIITGKWGKVWGDVKKLVTQGLSDVISQIKSVGSGMGNLLYDAGASVIHGLISGIKSALGGLGSTLGDIGSFITSHKGPPSYDKVMLHPAGRMIMQGLVDGLNSHLPVLAAATANVGATVEASFAQRMGIASPSKVFRSLGIYVNEGLIDGLTGSTARVKSATRRIESLLMETFNKIADQKGHKGVSNRWVAEHERTVRHLEAYAAKEDRVLRSLAGRRDSVATKIKAAQKALAAVQKQWNAEVKTVADGVMQGFSIVTQAPQEGFALSAADVVNHMRDQFQKATQFAAELQTLQKKGLSSTLVQQLASAGVDQGGETAAALAGATKGQIAQINSLQSATQSAANGVGAAVADSMYGAGLKSAQGLVKGLQSQEAAIERQMMRIAKSMQKAIKSALGIHSPSRVFAEIGTWIPKGLAKGIYDSAHHATAATQHLAGSVAGTGVGAGLAMAGGGGGGGAVVHNHYYEFTIEGNVRTIDGLARDIEAAFLKRGMRNPQSYPAYKR